MEKKIENAEWKIDKLKQMRKRCTFSICFNIVIVFAYSILYLFSSWWIVFGGAFVTAIAIVMSLRSIKAIQSYAQETMIYKLADESFKTEWNDYVTTVDFTLSKQYEAERNKKQ